MSLKIGIVGLPNVGKSTLFNALTHSKSAQAQNYPFCTIDPNVGIVEVPDPRLYKLSEISHSEKTIPAAIEFVDIAGLVKGASSGEGLGNKFLSHIRECQAIGHVVRFFHDENVTHVHGTVSPRQDREIIESELILADLQTLEKRLGKAQSDAKSGEQEKKEYAVLLENIKIKLEQGILALDMGLSEKELEDLTDLHLLTLKPTLYIINISEDEIGQFSNQQYAEKLGYTDAERVVQICARTEEELGDFSAAEAVDYLNSLGIKETGLNALIHAAYSTLGLITYFTSGPKESRAWTIRKGTFAPQAAGVIHTDFEKGFIRAEVIPYQAFIDCGGENGAREKGLLRSEGKEYIVQDGDIMHFRFNN